MSRRGRRVRKPRGPHPDKYAKQAGLAQEARAALDADWVRNHPVPLTPAAAPEASDDPEDEEVA
jgi:hypothetical protein